jgi:endoglucanase
MKPSRLLLPLLLISGWISAHAQSDNSHEIFHPANPPAMQPLPAHQTRAYEAAKKFQHGVNLGDYLEASRQRHHLEVTAEEIAQIKQAGFDHIRVPIGWHQYAGPEPTFTLEPEIFAKVDFVVTNALQNRLAVIINIHHFNALDQNPAATTAEFLALWQQITAHYQKFPLELAYELDNEPHDQATTAIMNPIQAQAIARIRQADPQRTIFVEPGGWGSIAELKNLVLPPDDNLIVSVHCYEPFHFTHQGATWTGQDFLQTNIVFPGPPATPLLPDLTHQPKPWVLDWLNRYNTLPTDQNPSSAAAFADKLKYVHAWSDYYGRPVHLGEFGAIIKADPISRAHFYEAFRRTAEQEHLGWCIWDWSANFQYWDKARHAPRPGMHEALFGSTH